MFPLYLLVCVSLDLPIDLFNDTITFSVKNLSVLEIFTKKRNEMLQFNDALNTFYL